MKQHINKMQLKGLNIDQINAFICPQYEDKKQAISNNAHREYNILNMFNMLGDICYDYSIKHTYKGYTATMAPCSDFAFSVTRIELCDALWELVKYILVENDEEGD